MNLKVEDFDCRYLVVRSAWVETAEDLLIHQFKPIWNNEIKICYGFGKHGDKSTTRSNERSPWDTLHPGRPWATDEGNTPNKRSVDHIRQDIAAHFQKQVPATIRLFREVFRRAGSRTELDVPVRSVPGIAPSRGGACIGV